MKNAWCIACLALFVSCTGGRSEVGSRGFGKCEDLLAFNRIEAPVSWTFDAMETESLQYAFDGDLSTFAAIRILEGSNPGKVNFGVLPEGASFDAGNRAGAVIGYEHVRGSGFYLRAAVQSGDEVVAEAFFPGMSSPEGGEEGLQPFVITVDAEDRFDQIIVTVAHEEASAAELRVYEFCSGFRDEEQR